MWRPQLTSPKHVLFTICFGVIFTDMVGYGVISPSIPLFARALSASDAQMGWAFAGYPIAFTLTVLPLGLLVDRIGRNWLIVSISMFVLALASVLMASSGCRWRNGWRGRRRRWPCRSPAARTSYACTT